MGKGSLLFHKAVIGEQSGVLCLLLLEYIIQSGDEWGGTCDNEEASNVCVVVWGP